MRLLARDREGMGYRVPCAAQHGAFAEWCAADPGPRRFGPAWVPAQGRDTRAAGHEEAGIPPRPQHLDAWRRKIPPL